MSSRTGSGGCRAATGSLSSRSSIELFRSAKSTVTVFRSPTRAPCEVRIFSARCLGVYVCGAANLAAGSWWKRAAHCPQNLLSGGLDAPQLGQTTARGAAHWPQKRAPAGLSCWQREHVMALYYRPPEGEEKVPHAVPSRPPFDRTEWP